MRSQILDSLISDAKVQDLLRQSKNLSWEAQLDAARTYGEEDWPMVCRIAFLLSNAALVSSLEDLDYVDESFNLLSSYPITDPKAENIFDGIVGYDFKDKNALFYFYLAILVLKLDITISARLILSRYDTCTQFDEEDWGQRTLYAIIKSLLLLIRKQQGLSDIREALRLIDVLRSEQVLFEDNYIGSIPIQHQQQKALDLLAIYHVSKAVYNTADYLVNGHSLQHRRIESCFLQSDDHIDILVCTPEKLDLLIRRSHPSVEDVSLFIVDEAHTIENGQRGAKLELLITMLRRERPDAKFMLLSPFLPDAGETMTAWLGGGNAIQVDWRPSEKLVFGLHLERKKAKFTVLPTALTTKITEEQHFESEVALVKKYMDEEIGSSTLYTKLLSKGVAVHHAGLSDETKILIEHLIRKGYVRYVCATTTIAEGVLR